MLQREFIDATNQFFGSSNFKRKGKRFALELSNIYVVFILLKSYYSGCYYLDYNISIKELNEHFDFSNNCLDIILQPRLTLSNGIVQLIPEELKKDEYIKLLNTTVTDLIGKISINKYKYLFDLQKKGFVFQKTAIEFIFAK